MSNNVFHIGSSCPLTTKAPLVASRGNHAFSDKIGENPNRVWPAGRPREITAKSPTTTIRDVCGASGCQAECWSASSSTARPSGLRPSIKTCSREHGAELGAFLVSKLTAKQALWEKPFHRIEPEPSRAGSKPSQHVQGVVAATPGLHLIVETCWGCASHPGTLRHKEAHYERHYALLKEAVEASLPGAPLHCTRLPTQKAKKRPRSAGVTRKHEASTVDQPDISRIGAFEVYLGVNLVGVDVCERLHSKISSGAWPQIKQITDIFIQRLASLPVPLGISVLDGGTKTPVPKARVIANGKSIGFTNDQGTLVVNCCVFAWPCNDHLSLTLDRPGLWPPEEEEPNSFFSSKKEKKIVPKLRLNPYLPNHVELTKIRQRLLDVEGKGKPWNVEVELSMESSWLGVRWMMKNNELVLLLLTDGQSASKPDPSWNSGEGIVIFPIEGDETQISVCGPENWVSVPRSIDTIEVLPPGSQPGFLSAVVSMDQKWKRREERLVPDPGLLRVLRNSDGHELLLRFGGPSEVPDGVKPATGVSALLLGEQVAEDSADAACSAEGCTWIGPPHHITFHLRECRRTLQALTFFEKKLPANSTRGALLVVVSWWNGAEPVELQLRLHHPCGTLCSMENDKSLQPGEYSKCSHSEGRIWGAEPGSSFQSGAVGASWFQHEEPPPNGRYSLVVMQSSGPPVAFNAVVAIGSTFTRVVAARSGGKGSKVSACSFQLPFDGSLLHPKEHPGNAQMASEWWALASEGASGATKEGVVNDSGWVIVPQDAPDFRICPPPDEPGLLPVTVKRSDIEEAAPGFLKTSFPGNKRLLRVLGQGIFPTLRYRLCFGGAAELPHGWKAAAHVKVEVVDSREGSESEDEGAEVTENWRTDQAGWCWVPSSAAVFRISPPDGHHLKFLTLQVERAEIDPILEVILEPSQNK